MQPIFLHGGRKFVSLNFQKKTIDYSSLCFVWEINKGAVIRILLFLLYERKVESKIIVKEFFQYYTTFGSEENFI